MSMTDSELGPAQHDPSHGTIEEKAVESVPIAVTSGLTSAVRHKILQPIEEPHPGEVLVRIGSVKSPSLPRIVGPAMENRGSRPRSVQWPLTTSENSALPANDFRAGMYALQNLRPASADGSRSSHSRPPSRSSVRTLPERNLSTPSLRRSSVRKSSPLSQGPITLELLSSRYESALQDNKPRIQRASSNPNIPLVQEVSKPKFIPAQNDLLKVESNPESSSFFSLNFFRRRTKSMPGSKAKRVPPPKIVTNQLERSINSMSSNVQFHVRARSKNIAQAQDEFDFQMGDIIAVQDAPEEGPWTGYLVDENRRADGKGKFPPSLVSTMQKISDTSSKNKSSLQVEAVYDYTAKTSDELSFRVGDIISVLSTPSGPYWRGFLKKDRKFKKGSGKSFSMKLVVPI